jgi:hypothetical protein
MEAVEILNMTSCLQFSIKNGWKMKIICFDSSIEALDEFLFLITFPLLGLQHFE